MTTPNRPPPTLTPSRPFVSTPCRTPGTGRRHRKSIILSAPKTPRDVRQLGRDEMIEYLVQNDQENPENLDQMMRADLQKRVIHCMKGLKVYCSYLLIVWLLSKHRSLFIVHSVEKSDLTLHFQQPLSLNNGHKPLIQKHDLPVNVEQTAH